VRIDSVRTQSPQRLLSTKVQQCFQHLAFQPLHQFHGHVKKIACAASRIKHAYFTQHFVKNLHLGCRTVLVSRCTFGLRRGLHVAPILAQRLNDSSDHQALDMGAWGVMRTEPPTLLLI